jgi:hypothetical protein
MGSRDHQPPGEGDILESGGRRLPVPRWWPRWWPREWPPPRWRPAVTAAVAATALLIGLAGGYAAGERRAAGERGPAAPRPAGPAPGGGLLATGFPLSQAGPTCAAQVGSELQLGVEVTNVSAASITLRGVAVVLPLGGLAPVAHGWGPCGELPGPSLVPGNTVPAGVSAWFTVMFRVLVRCPGPLPVQFSLGYDQRGHRSTVRIPGFEDLTGVRYSGCR